MADQETNFIQGSHAGVSGLTGVQQLKAMLFEELELIVRTSRRLMERIKEEEWGYRPQGRENMRSLQELVHHLAAVPAVDLLILQEHSKAEVSELEATYTAAAEDVHKLSVMMAAGVDSLRSYMEKLPDEQFLAKRTTPYYIDHPTAQAKWLIEIVTHAQHHRAQLFNYLKELGHPANMFDLY